MKARAKDVMYTEFNTLRPDIHISEAVRMFRKASEKEQKKVFGMMVTDDTGRLIGMISMYDILLFIRPKHIHIWGMMEDIDIEGLVDNACKKAQSILVGDIMTTDVITVKPETHLMMILDIMIKKHVRRIPVLDKDKAIGIVYISDLFYHLLERLDS
ncbi:MAG: CBS domain-containing protein [Candidatus Deferrimicrobiaceae bacterium]